MMNFIPLELYPSSKFQTSIVIGSLMYQVTMSCIRVSITLIQNATSKCDLGDKNLERIEKLYYTKLIFLENK